MNRGELDRQIERYYNGESTEEEEQALRELFINEDVPEGYEAERAVFGYYESAVDIPALSLDFESRIMSAIDATEHSTDSSGLRRSFLPWLSVAATVLILVGSWFFFIHRSDEEDTFTDPKIAYAETIKILLDVSEKMNRGAAALEPVRKIDQITSRSFKTVSRSTGKIGKNLEDLGNVLEPLEKSGKEVNENFKK
jgi:hypothetical protein